jgi:hypothetical protein
MTNSAPEPPENIESPEELQRRRAYLTFDEMVAIIVAFGTIGAILLWSLIDKREGVLNAQWQNKLFPSIGKTEIATQGVDRDADLRLNDRAGRGSLELEAEEEDLTGSLGLNSRTEANVAPGTNTGELVTPPPRRDRQQDRSRFGLVPAPIPLPSTQPGQAARPTIPSQKTPETTTPPPTKPPEATTPPPVTTPTPPPEATTPPPEKATPTTPAPTPTKELVFKDVPENYWAYPFINKLAERQLITGTSADKFEPDKLINRAEMATLIGQAFNLPSTQEVKSFKDVDFSKNLAADINKALGMGFMKGYSPDEFRPLENIPRYQVLVALATGLNLPQVDNSDRVLSKFGDSGNLPQWAKGQVSAATNAGLIVNRPTFPSSELQPNESATRAEVAASIYQALVQSGKLDPINSQYIVKP